MRFLLCFTNKILYILALFTPSLSLLKLEPVDSGSRFLEHFFLFYSSALQILYIHFSTDCMELGEKKKKFFASNKKYIYVQQRRSLIQCAYSRRMDCIQNMNRASEVSEQSRESSDYTRLPKKVFELSQRFFRARDFHLLQYDSYSCFKCTERREILCHV